MSIIIAGKECVPGSRWDTAHTNNQLNTTTEAQIVRLHTRAATKGALSFLAAAVSVVGISVILSVIFGILAGTMGGGFLIGCVVVFPAACVATIPFVTKAVYDMICAQEDLKLDRTEVSFDTDSD